MHTYRNDGTYWISTCMYVCMNVYVCIIKKVKCKDFDIEPIVFSCIVWMDTVSHIHRHNEAVPERSHQGACPNMSEYNFTTQDENLSSQVFANTSHTSIFMYTAHTYIHTYIHTYTQIYTVHTYT